MTEQATQAAPPRADLVMVPIDAVQIGPNIRSEMDQQMLLELQNSLKAIGLMEPVIVRKAGKKFILIAGHRRLEAAKRNGEDLIEAKVYSGLDDQLSARMQLTENLQREQLNHVDVARQLGRARDAGMSIANMAADINLSEAYVRKHLDLLRLCSPVLQMVASGRLPFAQAQLIARVGDVTKQIQLTSEVTDLYWDAKAGTWAAVPCYGINQDKPEDQIITMDDLRERVGYMMLSMATCGWPRDEKFAGQRPCIDCPDNTATYADQPALFAGINPRGSDKKGFCTNEACYHKKLACWDEVRAARKAEQAAKRQAKADKAAKAGLDVCSECFRIAQGDQRYANHDGRKLCPKCIEKAKKQVNRHRSESYDEREKRVKALIAKFPWTDEQKYAVATWQYSTALAESIGKYIAEGVSEDHPCVEEILLGLSLLTETFWWDENENKQLPSLGDLAHGEHFSDETLAKIWLQVTKAANYLRPAINRYTGVVENIPLAEEVMQYVEFFKALAEAWKLDVAKRPKLEDFQPRPIIGDDMALFEDVSLAKTKKADLVKLATEYRLDASGKKLELLARLKAHRDAQVAIDTADRPTAAGKPAKRESSDA